MKKKGFALGDVTIYLLIALAVLVLGLAAYYLFSGRGSGIIEKILNFFRFGR